MPVIFENIYYVIVSFTRVFMQYIYIYIYIYISVLSTNTVRQFHDTYEAVNIRWDQWTDI
jgi:hypothetical protein